MSPQTFPQFGYRGHFGQRSPLENWTVIVIGLRGTDIDNIFGRRSICSKCEETGKVDVSQNYVDRVMSEAMPNAVVWTGFAIRSEKTVYKKYWERKQNSSKNRWQTKALDVQKSSVQLMRLL